MIVNGRQADPGAVLAPKAPPPPPKDANLPPRGLPEPADKQPNGEIEPSDAPSDLEAAWEKLRSRESLQAAAVGGVLGGGAGVLAFRSLVGWALGTAVGAGAGYVVAKYVVGDSPPESKRQPGGEAPPSVQV